MTRATRFPAVQRWLESQQAAWATYSGFFECLLIVAAVLAFCLGFLDLGAPTRLPGNESEVFQMLDWVEYYSIRTDGAFPLWNPYMRTGLPYFADPMLHIYNPVVSLPVLTLGVRDGFKLAVFLSFLLAAFGMRQLGKRLGLNAVWRLWVVFFYAFAGQPAARFFQGQYLFIFGFAWIPWIFWGLLGLLQVEQTELRPNQIWQIRQPGYVYTAVSALALALLFFSGNAYYAFYLILILPLLALAQTLEFQKQFPFVQFKKADLRRLVYVGLLALALMAIQAVPAAEFWPWVGKHTDVVGVHTPFQVLMDFISRDPFRPDAYQALPAREEYYAYIGLWPFLGLALFPLAWMHTGLRRHGRLILFLFSVCALVVLWVGLDFMPWRELFVQTRWLVQFRALLRILIFGSLALVLLAALCLQSVWQQLAEERQRHPTAAVLGQAALVIFFLLGSWDIFTTNRLLVHSQPVEPAAYETAAWLQGQNAANDYVRLNPNNTWQDALVTYRLRPVEGWYHIEDIHPAKTDSTVRGVQARPVYLLQSPQESIDYYPDAELLGQVSGLSVYRLADSLPLVFSVAGDVLYAGQAAGPLTRSMVSAQNWVSPDVNSIETIASSASGETLVVLYTFYPGWKLYIDDRPADLMKIDGFLAAPMIPGVHKYVFHFQPWTFAVGVFISLAGLIICLVLLYLGLAFDRLAALSRLHAWRAALGNVFARPKPVEQPALPIPLASDPVWRQLVWGVQRRLRRTTFESALIGCALLVYLFVRMIGLTDWPIYFFTDEAVQTVMAADFIHQGLNNYDQEFLPTYFSNGPSYNLSSVTVYAQVLPYLIFGKSAYATRLVSVLFSALGALFLSLMLKNVFNRKYAWLGIMLLSITPAWFLHSRTAFEPVMMSAFYAGFLYFYMRYRSDQPHNLFAAIAFGALVFYTYSPGQLVMGVTGTLLFIFDLPYHLKQWRWIAWGILALLVVALPYARYLLSHPAALGEHLAQRAPYWVEPISLSEKLGHYFQEYIKAFNPAYWFLPNEYDLVRHLMKGYGHVLILTLPFCGLGLALALRNILKPAYRSALLALLAVPTGSALVQINITRALVMLIPLTLLTALGVCWLLERLSERLKKFNAGLFSGAVSRIFWVGGLFVVLMGVNFYMLADALSNGPLWYQDYTLAGMQYGARQLFGAVNEYALQHADRHLLVSPVWTNGTDTVKRFFVPDELNVELGSVTGYIFARLPLDDNQVFVVVPEEYQQIHDSGKFKTVQVEKILNYPNGKPGFYFVRLQYVNNIDQILEAERAQRRTLIEDNLLINNTLAHVSYSRLDIGDIKNAFDGNETTLLRTLEANPMVIQVDFAEPHRLNGMNFNIGGTNAQLTVTLYNSTDPPVVFQLQKQGSVADPRAELEFGKTYIVKRLRLEMRDLSQGEPGHTHLWEVGFK